jgi:hypothetical protein
MAPADGATDVPLNAVIHVHLEGGVNAFGPAVEEWLALETADGQPVPVTLELPPWSNALDTPVRMVPIAPLAARTGYRLRKLVIPLPNGTDIVGRFTTGDAVDTTAPAGVDAADLSSGAGSDAECNPGHAAPSCCSGSFPRRYQRIDLVLPLVTNEPVVYTLREGDRIVASDITGEVFGVASTDGMLVMDPCTPAYYPWEVRIAYRHVFTVTPRDVAGNEGPTSAEFVVAASESGCGCRLMHSPPSGHGLVALLSFIPLILVLRRRRPMHRELRPRGRILRLVAPLAFLGACGDDDHEVRCVADCQCISQGVGLCFAGRCRPAAFFPRAESTTARGPACKPRDGGPEDAGP